MYFPGDFRFLCISTETDTITEAVGKAIAETALEAALYMLFKYNIVQTQ